MILISFIQITPSFSEKQRNNERGVGEDLSGDCMWGRLGERDAGCKESSWEKDATEAPACFLLPLDLWTGCCPSLGQKSAYYSLQAKLVPAPYVLCMACRLRTNFAFLNGWEISKEEYCFMPCENQKRLSVPINKVLLGHGRTCLFPYIYSGSHTIMAESDQCNRDQTASQAWSVYHLARYQMSLPTPGFTCFPFLTPHHP